MHPHLHWRRPLREISFKELPKVAAGEVHRHFPKFVVEKIVHDPIDHSFTISGSYQDRKAELEFERLEPSPQKQHESIHSLTQIPSELLEYIQELIGTDQTSPQLKKGSQCLINQEPGYALKLSSGDFQYQI